MHWATRQEVAILALEAMPTRSTESTETASHGVRVTDMGKLESANHKNCRTKGLGGVQITDIATRGVQITDMGKVGRPDHFCQGGEGGRGGGITLHNPR